MDLSAAFAYYALQSIFPLLLIALAVAARIYGNGSGVDEVLRAIGPLLPPSVIDLVQSTLLGLVAQGFGAGLLGLVVLLVTASNVYLTLQRGADRLWQEVLPSSTESEPVQLQIVDFLRSRIQAFLVVLSVAVLIVVEQIVAGLARLPSEWLQTIEAFVPLLKQFLHNQHVFAFGSVFLAAVWLSLLAWALQKVLAGRRVPSRILIPGSIVIGVILSILNIVLSLSIVSLGNRFQAYGVIGGVLVLTFWVWLIGVILYYGQCLSVELVAVRQNRLNRGEPNLLQA